jgi:hypothetical protein
VGIVKAIRTLETSGEEPGAIGTPGDGGYVRDVFKPAAEV